MEGKWEGSGKALMVHGTRVFRAPGVPRVVGAPFAGMGMFFFVCSVCQLVGMPLVKLEGNVWIGVVLGGIFAAVGWGIMLQGTRLILEGEGRTYMVHRGLVIGGKRRRGTWEDFGLVEVQRESRDAAKGRTYWVWSVRLRWKEAGAKAFELAAFMEGRQEKVAREKARRLADEVAGWLGVMVLDQTGSEAVMREAGERVEPLGVGGAEEEAGPLPAGTRLAILQEDGEALRVMWRPERKVAEVLPLLVPMVMLGFFGAGVVKSARALGAGLFGPMGHLPLGWVLFFGVVLTGAAVGLVAGIGALGVKVLFGFVGSVEVWVDGDTVGFCERVWGWRLQRRSVAVGAVEAVVLRELERGRGRVIVVETAGRDLKMMAGVGEADGRWVVRRVRG